jgi:hypothetical protein
MRGPHSVTGKKLSNGAMNFLPSKCLTYEFDKPTFHYDMYESNLR